jgi:hypothetical protein
MLRIYAVDEAQNVSTNAYFELFLDQSPPALSLQSIAPAARQTAVPSIDATFNEAVNENTVSRTAFSLSRDGGGNLLGAAATLTRLSSTLYRLGNLTTLNTQAGSYVLSMQLTNVQDLAGNRGSGQSMTSWTILGESTNRPPVITAITNREVREGSLVSIALQASDPDSGQVLSYALRSGAPAGAAIDGSGLFTWQPNSLQGPAGYTIGVIATDNGQPSLSATQTFIINVRDFLPDVVLSMGRTNVVPSQVSSVPVRLDSGANLTNVAFDVEIDPALLGSFALQSPSTDVLGASMQLLQSNRCRISLALKPGVPASANRTLLRFGFTTTSNEISSMVGLHVTGVSATRDTGSAVVNRAGRSSRVVIVGKQPLLELAESAGASRLVNLYGRVNASYVIEYATNLGPAAVWIPVTSIELTSAMQTLSLPSVPATAFYRAREVPVSSLTIVSEAGGVVIEWPEACTGCVLEQSIEIGSKANWQPVVGSPNLVNGRFRMVRNRDTNTRFYRLALPGR